MEIRKIACVGAGLIGASWAIVFATRGLPVVLQDLDDETLADALKRIGSDLAFLAKKGLIEESELETAFGRIKTTTDLTEAVSAANYVQESVPEKYDIKKAVFKEMEKAAMEHTILASSTSALLIGEIQEATRNPERCVAVHPWNPPHLMPLVEIAGGKRTSEETIKNACKLMERVGKTPIVLKKEVPGYVANRIQAAVLREAIDIVDKGIASVEDVDKAVCAGPALRWAIMGPFLNHHLGANGIEQFFERLGPSYALRWSTMATWTSVTPSAASKVIEGVRESAIVRSRAIGELASWRDERLTQLLRILGFSKSD